ncbi:pyridoxamine 5'-phosphate oxidase family protein [Microbacterium sp. NPDC089189]|uniref:pyridoxamine 5'-phosphate oxidase family protein n=1 Tax=Microbacterium sp. NPDC089189 TaxID=3154972 RepID=UPI00343DAFCE
MDASSDRLIVDVPIIDHATDPVQSDHPADDPLALAGSWVPADGEDRMLMTLATIDPDGFPRTRTVMLSEFDGERFFFHTDAASRKVADLAADPKVALTLLWPGFTRQIVVQGTAAIAPASEAAAAYEARSPYLRQLAWLNTDEFAQNSRAVREQRWAEFAVHNAAPAQPAGWMGYAVTPHRFLFWVSNPRTASRRVEYTRTARGWERRYLPG